VEIITIQSVNRNVIRLVLAVGIIATTPFQYVHFGELTPDVIPDVTGTGRGDVQYLYDRDHKAVCDALSVSLSGC
jgi:hypothetical protein